MFFGDFGAASPFLSGRRFILSVRQAKALHCDLAIGAFMFFLAPRDGILNVG
jgi:hypothetical protein